MINFEKTYSFLEGFYKKTGIRSVIVDDKGKILNESSSEWFCKNYFCQNKLKCGKDHRLMLKESLKWGGLFIYTCHKEFVLWLIPVITDKKISGGILSGFLLFEQYGDLKDEYEKKYSYANEKLIFLSQEEVRTISGSMLQSVKQENLTDARYLDELEKSATIQREIAEKIIEKKAANNPDKNQIYEKQNNLINSIKYNEIKDIRSNLNDVLSEIYLEGFNDINLLKFRMLELFVLISRNIIEYGDKTKIENLYKLTREYVKKSEYSNDIYTFSSWLIDILNDFIKQVLEKREKLGRISKATDYIKNNLNKKLSVSEVARHTNLSESRFLFLFKENTRMSFTDYVNKTKIEKAKELMNSKEYNIVEISYALNYTDQSYFTKIFKKYTGFTPREYSKKK